MARRVRRSSSRGSRWPSPTAEVTASVTASATSLCQASRSSGSTQPRLSTTGVPTSRPLRPSTTTRTNTNPSPDMARRSSTSVSDTWRPDSSTITYSSDTRPARTSPASFNETRSPSVQRITWPSDIPRPRARSWWATRWAYSPCTGMNRSGSAASWRASSSSALPCPVVCTPSWPLCTSWTPRRARALWRRDTAASLPGMGCEEKTTVSRSPTLRNRWLPSAMRFRAARGSPCEPVHTTHVVTGSRSSSCSSVASIRSEIRSRPSSRARVTLRTIDGPNTTTVRPVSAAASTTCWIRWMWLEKAPTMIRRSSWSAKI